MNDKILLSSPHMGGNEQKYVKKAFDDNWIAPLGENVDKFEQAISDFSGSKGGASATSSGTAAIHLALRLLNVGRDDIVFAPSFTFIATINPILYQGAIPVFIDSEPETWNMSPRALERAMIKAEYNNRLPKAIIVVDLYGQMAKYDEILTIANRYNVPVIEDSAESLGSVYKGKKAGTMGDIGIFSFNGNKIITTSGGGALISNNKHFVDHSRFLATQARDTAPYYQHTEIGYNYRLSNVSAGIGRGQMEILPERIFRRRQIFKNYLEEFASIDSIRMMPELEGFEPNRWLSTLTLETADNIDDVVKVVQKLNEYNIETRTLWKPMHIQPLFKSSLFYEHVENEVSVSETLFNKGLCLPSGTNMNDEQLEYVIKKVKEVVK
ncbi:aminotransferase class I/II-fold pyridoxal phosphate-dependent enzyme [Enterococcus raffinosus]|uniref:aminotransferase class I/II-fold pyridoxal phosphate-dependent enzyme n=1 Tax=Enterococcus raffinosus TaxID=71452 RepID=UPI00288DED48|nr:aminotransferase class I/II-fold pyridoxal phosphate-dependent enzyme [Enterococcus raffinosus]MDT2573631.1 aminotransferase class I/II-fold pyridoxal phosphate-dependent enzyme [Enterococcus raffinosus]